MSVVNRDSAEFMPKFSRLCTELSPENLHCDGEITIAQARVKYRQIMKCWRELESLYGVKVTEDDVYRYEMAERCTK